MDNSKNDLIENSGAKTRWSLWITAMLLFSSVFLCAMSYFAPLYWFRVSYTHFLIVMVLSIVIIVVGVFWVVIPTVKKRIILNPVFRLALFVTLSLVSLNLCATSCLGVFFSNSHLDTVKYKGKVYRLLQDDKSDLAAYYHYMLCECGPFGQLCQCNPFYDSTVGLPQTVELATDSTGEILQVKYEDEEIEYECNCDNGTCKSEVSQVKYTEKIVYEYNGEEGVCHSVHLGHCLSLDD